ncbi:MAG TPA: DUF4402 domain-containing protein [Bacteroidales bacterium]|nr:DUF4402 domain-containing protein [Bacteroidales bacterium]
MKNYIIKECNTKCRVCLIVLIFLFSACSLFAQRPPRPITVTKVNDLAFGGFYQGATGGTVSVNAAGTRSATGTVILLGMGYTVVSAMFRITGNAGTKVNFSVDPNPSVLTGSNGGSMSLLLDPATNPLSPITLTGSSPSTKDVYIGGTLTVGNSVTSPPGVFTGSLSIIFNQE